MKIGMITLHRSRNYGSVLQAFALQRKLEDMGCNVEVIDYYPERYSSFGLLKRLKNKIDPKWRKIPGVALAAQLMISVSYVKKKIIFDGYLKRKINLSEKTYKTKEDLYANVPKADMYCTGSDQVWNSHWNEGIDFPLYLDFVADAYIKFAYAASFGKGDLDTEELMTVKNLLAKYDYVSIREISGLKIVDKMGIAHGIQVLDPTLLFCAEEWDKYVSKKSSRQKYILTYNLHHDRNLDKYANELSQRTNLPIYNISYNWHDIIRKGKLKWCPSVEEYLRLIKDAEHVIADSFHATVFSLVFHKQFVVLYPDLAGSRLTSILSLTGLMERGIFNFSDTSLADKKIDYTKVDQILQEERKKADSFLNKIVCQAGSPIDE